MSAIKLIIITIVVAAFVAICKGEDSSLDIIFQHEYLSAFQHLVNLLLPYCGSRDGAVVRALASHRCGSGSIGLSLLLVLFSVPRGFSPGTPVFPSTQKPTFPNSNSIHISVNE